MLSNPEEFFTKIYKHIEGSDGFYSPATGEAVDLSVIDKLIYSYMLDKQTAFAVSTGGVHFETQATIADNLRLSRKTVSKTISKLMEHGVIVGVKPQEGKQGFPVWQYTGVKHPLKTWRKVNGIISPLVIVKNAPKTKQHVVYESVFDDPNLPF